MDQKLDKAITANELFPASADNMNDLETSLKLMARSELPGTEPASGSQSSRPSAPQTKELCISKDKDGNLKIVSSGSQPSQASEMDLSLIPPPLDFMDELEPPPLPEKAQGLRPSSVTPNNKPRVTVDLEVLRQRASTRGSSPVTLETPNKPPELSPPSPHRTPPPEAIEPKSPPAVAPKPKKLPANIILKSHKAAPSDGSSGHSVPTSSDRLLLDPQRVHLEALRKLGLLKGDEADSGLVLSPKLSPQTRRSWAAPSPPVSPAAPHTPPLTPSYTRVGSPSPASVSPPSPAAVPHPGPATPPAVQPPHIVPAPAAFSDPDGPSENAPAAAGDVSGAQVNTPPRTPPSLIKQLPSYKDRGVKSTTLERSGPGLSSYMAGQDAKEKLNPSLLRNSRPRPASLGSRKEFSSTAGSQVGHASSKEPVVRRSLPASQKLPRSQGISVLICPRSENEDERREALKRLGLLRD